MYCGGELNRPSKTALCTVPAHVDIVHDQTVMELL